jgi:cytochrome P450
MRPISVLFPYLPTAFHRRRDAAREQLRAIFTKVIQGRRKSGAKEDDILQVGVGSTQQSHDCRARLAAGGAGCCVIGAADALVCRLIGAPSSPHGWLQHHTRPVAAPYSVLLQVLIDSRYKNVYGGRATTDDEIAGLLIALLFAGQHTSSVTSSWTGYRMLSNPKWLQV